MKGFFLPVIIIVSLVSFCCLGSVTLFDVDEAVFAQATKEMVQGGDWITPHYNGEIRYDKPILIYWLMAFSYKVFGVNEFGARFPSALAGVILAVSFFFFTRRYLGERGGLLATLSLVLTPYFFAYTHASVTDMTLTLFITLSLLSFYHWTQAGTSSVPLYGFYLFSSFAFLTKGLIGIVFPFGIALVYLVLTRGVKKAGAVFSLSGAIIFLLAAVPWYAAEFAVNGWEFIDQLFIKHHFKRFTAVNSGHEGPLYFYLVTLLAGMFPWIFFLPSGIREAVRGIRTKEKESFASLPFFCLIWFGFIFLFFSLSTTKLPNYILPSVPAAAILIAWGCLQGERRWKLSGLAGIGLLAVVSGAGTLVAQVRLHEPGLDLSWLPALAVVFALFTVTAFVSLVKRRALHLPLAVVSALFLLLLAAKALPMANEYFQGTLHRYSLVAKEKVPPGERVVTYRLNNPSIIFYSDRLALELRNRKELLQLPDDRAAVAICKAQDSKLLQEAGFKVIEEDGRYAVLERD